MEVADNPFQRFITLCIRALNKSEIDYVLIGGVIVSIYGRPRSTMDLDVIIEQKFLLGFQPLALIGEIIK